MIDLSQAEAISWSEKIIAVAIVLQTIELFQLRAIVSDRGIWRWPLVRQELGVFPGPVRWVLDCCLAYRSFLILLSLRLLAALSMLLLPEASVHWLPMLLLVISTLLIAIRWRGTFNGGSDYMTLIVVLSLCVARCFEGNATVGRACLSYMAVQCAASYFVAGTVKVRGEDWRNGKALQRFLSAPCYGVPAVLRNALHDRRLALAASWAIMSFECSFPLALLHAQLGVALMVWGLVFHLVNVYAFGLNRFLFAWAATYPAVYWCSTNLAR